MDEKTRMGYEAAAKMGVVPRLTIACPKCNTVKLIKYFPQHDEDKFEGCWACNVSSKAQEWEVIQVITD